MRAIKARTQPGSPSAGSLNRSREESQRHPPHWPRLQATNRNSVHQAHPPGTKQHRTSMCWRTHRGAARRCLPPRVAAEDGKCHRGSTRHHAHQTVPILVRWLPNTIEAWALGLQGGPSYRKGGTVLPNATPLLDEVHVRDLLARCQQTHDGRHTDMPVCDDATRRTTACIKHCTLPRL
jgi:hypothetical protein